MTASRTGLAILTAIALALAAVHVLAAGRAGAESRRPFAGLDPDAVTELRWDRAGERVALVRDLTGWTMTAPSPGPADAAVVADVLDTIRTARWQRRAQAAPGAPRVTLALRGAPLDLAIGPDAPGAGSWLSDGHGAYLFEPWVIAALDRDALALRVRSPVSTPPAQITGVEIHGDGLDLVLVGAPLAIADRGHIPLHPDVARELAETLAAIRVESLVGAGASPPPPRLTVRVLGGAAPHELLIRGPCPERPDQVWIGGTAGEACTDGPAVWKLELRARAIATAPLPFADPRPVAGPITEVTLASGARLRWHGATVEVIDPAGDRPADDDAVARVVAALTGPAAVVALPARRPPATGALAVTTAAGAENLELLAGDLLARATSPVAHRLSPDAVAALRVPAEALRDRTLWRSEPSLLTGIIVSDPTPRAIPVDDPWARELADALAAPRAVRLLAGAPPTRRTIELTYAPPPAAGAAPEVHRVDVGAITTGGCAAVADGQPAVLPTALCRLLAR